MLLINREKSDARVRVELYSNSSMPAESPAFYIYKNEDPEWFDYFRLTFEDCWKRGKPYSSPTGIKQ